MRQSLQASFEYPVIFGRNLLARESPWLADSLAPESAGRARVLAFLDEGLAEAWPDLEARVEKYMQAHADRIDLVAPPVRVPGGEAAKQRRGVFEAVLDRIAGQGLCRQSLVLAIGGGSMLDVVGFAAALVHRGLRLVRMPSTVLSQNDSGVGVKNGIDARGVKNLIGAFSPPFAVLIDFDFLRTLPEKYRLGGLAESFKVALIRDAGFFHFLAGQAAMLRAGDERLLAEAVRRSALLHLEHLSAGGDPFELGSARPLDFGHWAAHRLEVLSGYALGHGQAVSIGIALDSYYAREKGLLSADELRAILEALDSVGLPLWSPCLEAREKDGSPALRRGLEDFREHLGGILHVTLPRGLGRSVEVHSMDWSTVAAGIHHLKRYAQAGHAGT